HRAFIALPVALQRRLIRAILRTYDEEGRASRLHIVESVRRELLKGRRGTRLSLKQVLVTLEQGSVLFSAGTGGDRSQQIDSEQQKGETLVVRVPSTVSWASTNQQIQVQLMTRRTYEEMGRDASQPIVSFDADRFSQPLLLRAWEAGDRFSPYG